MAEVDARTVFVTVGSTKFEALVEAVCDPRTLDLLHRKGYAKLVLQIGSGRLPQTLLDAVETHGDNPLHNDTAELPSGSEVSLTWRRGGAALEVVAFRYRGSIERELRAAELVVSHAGAGTALEALALGCRLVVVVNDLLMDSHQAELAGRLADLHCVVACRPHQLHDVLAAGQEEHLQPYTPGDPAKFLRYLSSVFVRRPA